MNILAIESSCDETACAVIKDGTEILGSAVASSTAMHEKWGGIVPEVAAREQLSSIIPVLTEVLSVFSCHPTLASPGEALAKSGCGILDSRLRGNDIKNTIQNNIDAVAVAVGPGLIGSLLIGVETAKTIALVTGKPIIPVNHVLAHMYANFLRSYQSSVVSRQTSHLKAESRKLVGFPAISLVVSGGHTELFLMTNEKNLKWLGGTIDDAAGEAFDKTARLLGFGSKGGIAIQEAAKKYQVSGIKCQIKMPRPMMHDGTLNFSFSGLKTAVMREWKKLENPDSNMVNAFAHEIQDAITDVLVTKTLTAAKQYDAKSILISGGVAANERLREKMREAISHQSSAVRFHCPPIELCTDNAAYIGSYAYFRGISEDWHSVTAIPDLSVEE